MKKNWKKKSLPTLRLNLQKELKGVGSTPIRSSISTLSSNSNYSSVIVGWVVHSSSAQKNWSGVQICTSTQGVGPSLIYTPSTCSTFIFNFANNLLIQLISSLMTIMFAGVRRRRKGFRTPPPKTLRKSPSST